MHKTNSSQQWTEKYRPTNLSSVLWRETDATCDMLMQMCKKKSLHNLLVHGPPGCGKTTAIVSLCNELYPGHQSEMILQLNASDDRGINIIRDDIKIFSKILPIHYQGHMKIVLLDEADALTIDAQFALRRVIEKFSHRVRFFLICNYLTKLIDAIISRCQVIEMMFVSLDHILLTQEYIAKNENITFKSEKNIPEEHMITLSTENSDKKSMSTEDKVKKDIFLRIANFTNMDLRSVINTLHSICILNDNVISYDSLYLHFFHVGMDDYLKLENIILYRYENDEYFTQKKSNQIVKKVEKYRHDFLQYLNEIDTTMINIYKMLIRICLDNKKYDLLVKFSEGEYYYVKNGLSFDEIQKHHIVECVFSTCED